MKFGFNEVIELGSIMSEQLKKCDIKEGALTISIDKLSFYKLDEELYYRNNGDEKKYIPSVNELNIKFDNINMNIKAK